MAEPMTAADEVRAYLSTPVTPAMFGRVLVEQLLAELDAVTARAEQAEAKATYWQGRAQSAWTDGDRVANDLVVAVFGDGGVREEFRRKWARIAALGDPETQHRLIGVSGEAHTPTERDLALKAEWLPGVRHEVRDVYPGPWRDADAARLDGAGRGGECTACGTRTADGSESEAPGADWVCGDCHVAIAASHQTPASAAGQMP